MNYAIRVAILGCLFLSVATVQANPAAGLPPIKILKDVEPAKSAFDDSSAARPLVIRSADEAKNHFTGDALAALTERVDFDKQYVLVFAWHGSGQDKLDYVVQESYPEQVVFNYQQGRTRDRRAHVYLYALRSNVTWSN